MPKLFISHASEDKEPFVRPLVAALTKERLEVWFDEFSLKLGDSLRSKIDEGLRTSDFGVVVLSHAFFSKKWPVDELNGLFALETTNRKLILPIWYKVDKEAVRQFSPILADRVGVSDSKGLNAVVEEIKVAVGISERTREVLAPDPASQALASMIENLTGLETDARVLGSTQGINLLYSSYQRIAELIWAKLQPQQRFKRAKSEDFLVHGPAWVSFYLLLQNAFANSALKSKLELKVFRRKKDAFHIDPVEHYLQDSSWIPTVIGENRFGYRERLNGPAFSEEEISSKVVEVVCEVTTAEITRLRTEQS